MKKRIMACIDASPYAEAICEYAVWAANKLQAPMSVIHVLDKALHTQTPDLSGSIGLGSQELLLQQLAELDEKHGKLAMERGRHILDAAAERAEQAGVADVDQRLRHGQLVETLVAMQDETRLVVMGKRGFSSAEEHGHIGLHVERVIRSISSPILLTQQRYVEPKRIMLAFDGSATAEKCLTILANGSFAKGLPVHIVMAGDKNEENKHCLAAAILQLEQAGFTTQSAIVEGDPETVLNEYQQRHNIDMMVMGAYGHSRIRQFIVGSTTTGMICNAKCSLLILR
ncbi:universal stress protein [Rheinheimera sp. MMS21-TC3]|uniref:universal stress protein n=1 Tax=Rheinheimera sp. MMS21-TC3 TaxID=3072790 RepID=UPI0028C3E3DC|nr:universal stress protein [Rheinheimera sp. MMS21-TC3]WNO62063.1 universal stress protein [Rheinheimera sp. MMS21-TC3]